MRIRNPANNSAETLEEHVKSAALYSFVTAMGFFAAFILSWLISLRQSACLVNCCCGFVGCECQLGDMCCEDTDHGGGGEDTEHVAQPPRVVDRHGERATLISDRAGRAESAFTHRAPPAYLYPIHPQDVLAGSAVGASGQHAGQLGVFMLMVEFLDAVPEAAVVAIGIMEGGVSWSLVVSIFMLNITSGLATFTDLITNSSERQSHLLFFSATLASGMLVFSVSNDIYSHFQDEYKLHEQGNTQLISLMGGTAFGACLVLALMWLHNSAMAQRMRGYIYSFVCFCCVRQRRHSYRPEIASSGCEGAFVSFFLVTGLITWTVSLCCIFVVLFNKLYGDWNDDERHTGISFIEGLSGGAFIVTVGGTLIPFSQVGARGIKNWGRTRKAVVAALTFTLGLMTAEVLSTVL